MLAGPGWLLTGTRTTGCLIVVVALVLAMLRAGALARRIPDPKLAGSCAICAALLAFTGWSALATTAAAHRASPDEQMHFLHAFTLAAAGLTLIWARSLICGAGRHMAASSDRPTRR
jgi:hypothetical protein